MKKGLSISMFFVLLALRTTHCQTTIVLQPGPEGKDAFLDDYYSYNIGDYQNMYAMAGTSGGIPITCRSIFEFDLSVIPENSEILEANLSLYYANDPANPHTHYGQNATYLQRVVEPWDEHTVTWWNQPQSTTLHQVRLRESLTPTQDYLDINIRDLVLDMLADPENSHGLLMRLETEEMYRRIMFASSDYPDPALRPMLVIIYKECDPPLVKFNYSIQDQTVIFQSVCPTAQSWLWDFGDGYLSTLENPYHQYEIQGTYEVCLHVMDSCGGADHCEEIEVCQYPVSGFRYINEGLTVFFTDSSEYHQTWMWSFGDGYYSDLENPWHTYDTIGNYNVCLQTFNECGSDTLCQVVFVEPSGLDEFDKAGFKAFPNPAKELLTVVGDFRGAKSISLLDLNGKVLYFHSDDLQDEIEINTATLSPGIYLLRMDDERGIFVKKIVKIKF